MNATKQTGCPCGSGAAYRACCEPLHQGTAAATAEALMRSRYSAFVLGLREYLLATWHPSTRPQTLEPDAGPRPQWLGLEVRRHTAAANRAQVEFVARYRVGGRGRRLHEVSRFVREDGRWFYLDGEFPQA